MTPEEYERVHRDIMQSASRQRQRDEALGVWQRGLFAMGFILFLIVCGIVATL